MVAAPGGAASLRAWIVTATPRPYCIAITALGGQGGGVLADWIADAAEQSGFIAQVTSVPGVAQRTGATVYYLELYRPEPADNEPPVLALMPTPGQVDVVIAAELMEAGRAMLRGLVSAERTTLIASTHRDYAYVEKAARTSAIADPEIVIEAARNTAHRFITLDARALAERMGCGLSAVLLGAFAATRAVPIDRAAFLHAIRASGLGDEANLSGFHAGHAAAGIPEAALSAPAVESIATAVESAAGTALARLYARVSAEFPPTCGATLRLGVRKLLEYQDEAYAGLYLDRLRQVVSLDSGGAQDAALTNESARQLALWMAYEDVMRVAQVKIRRARFERARADVRAAPDQIVELVEFLHPRLEEFMDTLPVGVVRVLKRSATLRAWLGVSFTRGRTVRTTRLRGFALLAAVAALRRWRRSTSRYVYEQRAIEAWLRHVVDLARPEPALALEVARCPRVRKGYGDTLARGRRAFEALMVAVPRLRGTADAAPRLARLRESALTEEHESGFQATLATLGAASTPTASPAP